SSGNQGSVNACYATGSVNGTEKVGGVVGNKYLTNAVTFCYWQNNALNGIGADGGTEAPPSNEGATKIDEKLITWEVATNVMNQNSKSSIKFVYSGSAPTLPI